MIWMFIALDQRHDAEACVNDEGDRTRNGIIVATFTSCAFSVFVGYSKIKYEIVSELFQLDAIDRDMQKRGMRKRKACTRWVRSHAPWRPQQALVTSRHTLPTAM